jgi:hypothetical protein
MFFPVSSRDGLTQALEDAATAQCLLNRSDQTNIEATAVEFDSLKLEMPEEKIRLRSIKSFDASPAQRKMAYKNASLWSPKSASLEQLIKPLVNCTVQSWPNFELLDALAEFSEDNSVLSDRTPLCIVDTLISRLKECNEVRYGMDRLCSPWSFHNERFELNKVRHLDFFVIKVFSRCISLQKSRLYKYSAMTKVRLFLWCAVLRAGGGGQN